MMGELEIGSSKEQQRVLERCLALAVGGRLLEEEARSASSLLFSVHVERRLFSAEVAVVALGTGEGTVLWKCRSCTVTGFHKNLELT